MTFEAPLTEPSRMAEPQSIQEYSKVLTQVAQEGKPVILSRDGTDLAAVVPLAQLEMVRDLLARQEVEQLAAEIDWHRLKGRSTPPQEWFEDTDNPFEPD